MQTLTIIIVSWNVRDLLRRCLQTVAASLAGSDMTYRVVVVDNASNDGTVDLLRAEFPHILVYALDHNLGFAAGNNLALRTLGFDSAASDQVAPRPASQFVLLLNPDTEIVATALLRLVHFLEQHPDVIAVGPQLRFADGSVQSSRRRFPTRGTFFWESTPLERLWPANPWARAYHCAEQPDTVVQAVDWLVGAALLVRGTAITGAGLLDAGFFLYSEELEWQYRLQACGQRSAADSEGYQGIIYLPEAVVIHHEGRSSEQVLPGRHIHFQRSKLRLARQWYGPVFADLLRGFLLLCYAWELASEMAKYLLGHRRALRRQRIRVYLTVLQNGLDYTAERNNSP